MSDVLSNCHTNSQQHLVVLEALGGGAADDGRDGAPLAGHQLGQVQQLLLLLVAPLRLWEGAGGDEH